MIGGTEKSAEERINKPIWSSIKSFMPTKLMKYSDIRVYGVPKLTNGEMKKVEVCLAIHEYITGTPFQRIEEEYFLNVFQSAEMISNYQIIRRFPMNCCCY